MTTHPEMRVLLDATSLPPRLVGVGRYISELAGALAAREDVDLHVVAKTGDAAELRASAPGASLELMGTRTRPGRIVWGRMVLPRTTARIAPDVFHGPHYTVPPSLGCPAVVTFHDATHFTHPHLHERAKVAYFRRAGPAGIRRSRRVIAVSAFSRDGAIAHAGADPDRVDVVPNGVALGRYAPEGDPERDAKHRAGAGVTEPYLLWVGAIEPRKDVPSLVAAYADLVRMGATELLVLAGPRAWGAAEVDEAIERSGVGGRIIRTGYVSEDEKIALYRGASAFVYPSIAEGFGLPVLEAMACGCAVVTTSGSAPEDVGGDAVELVPPGDTASLRDAVSRVLGDDARARDLRSRALTRAREFSWERTAERTLDVYRRAIG